MAVAVLTVRAERSVNVANVDQALKSVDVHTLTVLTEG